MGSYSHYRRELKCQWNYHGLPGLIRNVEKHRPEKVEIILLGKGMNSPNAGSRRLFGRRCQLFTMYYLLGFYADQ